MKNLLKVSFLVLLSMFILVSCEENEVLLEDALIEESGIESSTTKQEMVKTEVVLQKSYDENFTLEEAQAQWEKDLSNFELPKTSSSGTDWYTSFVIQTGNEPNSGTATYSTAYVRWHVRTHSNNMIYGIQHLEGEIIKGETRFYLVKNTAAEALASISLQSACIAYSSGTDNWHIANLKVELRRWDQTHTAIGYSGIYEVVDTWLQIGYYVTTDAYCLDYYYPYESGILYFLNEVPTEDIYQL